MGDFFTALVVGAGAVLTVVLLVDAVGRPDDDLADRPAAAGAGTGQDRLWGGRAT